VWNSDPELLAHQTIHFGFKKIQRNGQRTCSEPLILRAFFEQTRQSFNLFLKQLKTYTYLKSFHKNSDQEVITKSKNHPTHGVEGRQDVVFHYSILKQSLHVVGWCHSECRVLFFQGLKGGPFSGKAQYLGVYPRGTELSPPHTPSCRKFHCLKLDSSEHQMCGLL
jgi:hypothetical protein